MEDYLAQQKEKEARKYSRLTLVAALIFIALAILLNVSAALVSFIALWQALLWVSCICVVVATLFAFLTWWVTNNVY